MKPSTHLRAVFRQRASVHAAHHAAVDPVLNCLVAAAAGRDARVFTDRHREAEITGFLPGPEVARCACQSAVRKPHFRIRDIRPQHFRRLSNQMPAVVCRYFGKWLRATCDQQSGHRDQSDNAARDQHVSHTPPHSAETDIWASRSRRAAQARFPRPERRRLVNATAA